MGKNRLNVSLTDEDWALLGQLADQTQVEPGTIARSLLSRAIEEANPDARHIVAVLDGIPGAFERAVESRRRGLAGETIDLDEL
jgi:hypothetical protein